MDPCWKFPYEDVGELFAQATVTEAMLVALEHMQVNWVTVGKSRLDKFFKNVISFPQESASFLARMGALSSFCVGDRVNSSRGPGVDVERPVVWAASATAAQRRGWGEDLQGRVVFPATVEEVYLDGRVRLRYDAPPESDGAAAVASEEGVELQEHLAPRVQMPWHPKYLKENLVICLRRNVGHGKVLEGLEVRWAYVCRLIAALTRLGNYGLDGERRPMRKWYDRRLFDVLDERQVLEAYAPHGGGRGVEGEAMSGVEEAEGRGADGLDEDLAAARVEDASSGGVSLPALRTGRELRAAGFEVRVVGGGEGEGEGEGGVAETVSREVFCKWLEVSEVRWGSAMAEWWCRQDVGDEGAVEEGGRKASDDDTVVDLYRQIVAGVAGAHLEVKEKAKA